MASTGTRLRKTFKYPSDSENSDASRDELDEEEQERLIIAFQEKNTHQNAFYTLIFTLVPLLLTLPFILTFPTSPLLSILGITSLSISVGRMRFSFSSQPPPPRKSNQTNGLVRWLQLTDLEHRLVDAVPEGGPLRMALPWLNVAICAVLGLAAALLYRRGGDVGGSGQGNGMWILCPLPAIALMMVEIVVRSMRDVEKGVGELETLKYRYKGA